MPWSQLLLCDLEGFVGRGFGFGVGGADCAVKDGREMVVWCWRRREMECRPMAAPWNNVCICGLWLRTVILGGDFLMICHACMAVVFWRFQDFLTKERVHAFLLHNDLVIFHAFGAATRFPNELSCFSALMRCHEISSWHLMLCLTPPMRLLCFYLMRCCAIFAAYFSGKTSSWGGLRYAISYCWRQSKDCLVRCHSCGPPDEVSSFDSVVVCCIIVS